MKNYYNANSFEFHTDDEQNETREQERKNTTRNEPFAMVVINLS